MGLAQASADGQLPQPGPARRLGRQTVEKERASRVHTPLAVRKVINRRSRSGAGEAVSEQLVVGRRPAANRLRRGWLVAVSLATIGAVAGIGGSAAALPQPTVAQVKA
jgi:hypothetical protein